MLFNITASMDRIVFCCSFYIISLITVLFRQILDTFEGLVVVIYEIKIDEATRPGRAQYPLYSIKFRDLRCETKPTSVPNSQVVFKAAVRRATLRIWRERPVIATALTVYVKEGPKVQ